jgi:hypothetical protein
MTVDKVHSVSADAAGLYLETDAFPSTVGAEVVSQRVKRFAGTP